MCGILGYSYLDIDSKFSDIDFIKSLEHRGPDANGFFKDEFISLLHTRLSIVDIESGHQPYEYDDLVITFNGEIYNHVKLKNQLKAHGYEFETNSDTEVLLKAFHYYGKSCTEHLNGMYAFCIYNKVDRSIIFCRDHFGIKPLYIYRDNKGIAFSSEMKSLMFFLNSNNIDYSINDSALTEFIDNSFIEKNHLIKNIFPVKPGYFIEINKNCVNETKSPFNKNLCSSDLSSAIEDELKEQLQADVEVGILLSGGIDSSLLTALSSKFNKNLKTFSIAFDGEKEDESKYSRKVSKIFKTSHFEYSFSERDLIKFIPSLINSMDTPIYDPAMLPLLYLAKNVSNEVKVALSGDGGDEIFAGYTHHRIIKYKRLFKTISSLLGVINLNSNIKRIIDGSLATNPDLESSLRYDLFSGLDKQLLRKTDLCSMQYGLEVRVPFLSPRIFNYSNQFKRSTFINILYGKLPLRKLTAKLVSFQIGFKKKQGFRIPLQKWVSSDSLGSNIKDDLLENCIIPSCVFSAPDIKNLFLNKDKNYEIIFKLFILNKWLYANKNNNSYL